MMMDGWMVVEWMDGWWWMVMMMMMMMMDDGW